MPNSIRTKLTLKKGKYLIVLTPNQAIMLLPSRESRNGTYTTIDSRGRIFIPISIISALGIKKGNLLKVSLDDNKILLSPTKFPDNISYRLHLDSHYRIKIPAELFHILGSPKRLYLTPTPDYSRILLFTTHAGDFCCPVKSRKRITINKKLRSLLKKNPGDSITFTVNLNSKPSGADVDSPVPNTPTWEKVPQGLKIRSCGTFSHTS